MVIHISFFFKSWFDNLATNFPLIRSKNIRNWQCAPNWWHAESWSRSCSVIAIIDQDSFDVSQKGFWLFGSRRDRFFRSSSYENPPAFFLCSVAQSQVIDERSMSGGTSDTHLWRKIPLLSKIQHFCHQHTYYTLIALYATYFKTQVSWSFLKVSWSFFEVEYEWILVR